MTRDAFRVAEFGAIAAFALLTEGARAQLHSRPDALTAMEAGRKSMSASTIDWNATDRRGSRLHFVSRFARNGDTIFENRGDSEGWVTFDGQSQRGTMKYPRLYLDNADGYWQHWETFTAADHWERDGATNPWANEQKDIRGLGVSPDSGGLRGEVGLRAIWESNYTIHSWREEIDAGIHVVTADLGDGRTVTWWVNPEKGWNAERVLFQGRASSYEAISTLERFGDTWFPRRVQYLQNGQVIESVEVASAVFNSPQAPRRFSPSDIGVEVGTHLQIRNHRHEPGEIWRWNGDAVVKDSEWYRELETGRRDWGPWLKKQHAGTWESDNPYTQAWERDRNRLDSKSRRAEFEIKKRTGLWEEYVEDFIRRYDLNAEQTEKAHAALKNCQTESDRHIQRVRTELVAVVDELATVQKQGTDNEAVKRLEERRDKLTAPLERIFEDQLKPRLDRLPTRAQRQKAEAAAATQPG